jgi:hypothetical protein
MMELREVGVPKQLMSLLNTVQMAVSRRGVVNKFGHGFQALPVREKHISTLNIIHCKEVTTTSVWIQYQGEEVFRLCLRR